MLMTPNIDYIKKLADGSEAFEKKMINILKNEFPEEKKQFLDFYAENDFFKASEVVHKLKHKIGMLNMKQSYEFVISFESELKSGNIANYSKFIVILDILDNFISDL